MYLVKIVYFLKMNLLDILYNNVDNMVQAGQLYVVLVVAEYMTAPVE